MSTGNDFQQTIDEIKSATQEFCKGNSNPVKALWSRGADATIMGAWGAYEHTWDEVGPRLDWAASRFIEGHATFETVDMGEDGALGYTIWIERFEARVRGSDEIRPVALRVTQLYRCDADGWKIIHRHADAIMEKIAATAILDQ